MQPLLNHMVLLHLLDFHKDTTTRCIAPGSSWDPMEKSLKSDLYLLMLNLTLIKFARKRPHRDIIEIWLVAFHIWPNIFCLICEVFLIILHRDSTINFVSYFRYDSLTVYDGGFLNSKKVGTFCGSSLPPDQIISSSRALLMHFTTNKVVIYDGFHIDYSSLCKPHRFILFHTVAIWTFTFHKKSGYLVISWFGRQISNKPGGQTNQPFHLKIQIYYTHFFLLFAEFVKPTAFYTLWLLFQRVDIFEMRFDAKIAIQICQLIRIAATVCKKQWIWQILQ